MREGLRFYSIEEKPFRIYGVFREGEYFRRLPEAIAKKVSEGVYGLHACGAGGRVRFVTDSPYVAIRTRYSPQKMPHFAMTGSSGFDMYSEVDGDVRYEGTYIPPYEELDEYEEVLELPDNRQRIITINFPLFSSVKEFHIGIKEGCALKKAPDYKIEKPIVFYGSSITQGACASRPGTCYTNILSRRLDFDFINLGFGGNAKAEDEIVEYITSLDMHMFVMDYDHNAPTVEHLENTHKKMFETIRRAHPTLPILIMPRPQYYLNEDMKKRQDVVYRTYRDAKDKGDENVYFIDGKTLMRWVKGDGYVDKIHPTDSGFLSMANAIAEVMKEILS